MFTLRDAVQERLDQEAEQEAAERDPRIGQLRRVTDEANGTTRIIYYLNAPVYKEFATARDAWRFLTFKELLR